MPTASVISMRTPWRHRASLCKPTKLFGAKAGVLEDFRKKLRTDSFAVVECEDEASPIGMHEKPMASAPPDLFESGTPEGGQHAPGGQLRKPGHALCGYDDL